MLIEDIRWGSIEMSPSMQRTLLRAVDLIESQEVYQFASLELEELADQISESLDLKDLSHVLCDVVSLTGFEDFSLFALCQGDGGPFTKRVCTSIGEKWLVRYQECGYFNVDPVVVKSREQTGSFLLSETPSSSPIAKAFWSDAAAHGVGRNGICHVLQDDFGARFSMSFTTSKPLPETNQILRLFGSDLVVLAELAIRRFCLLVRGDPHETSEFTDAELYLLHSFATGRLMDSSRYGEVTGDHMGALKASVCQKMNVQSIVQAVAVASSQRWFDYLPFRIDETVVVDHTLCPSVG